MADSPTLPQTRASARAAIPALAATPYSHPEFYRPPLVYPDVPFHEMLARTALRVPERPAIIWRDTTITYRELYALARSAAVALRALDLKKGDKVCLLMANRPEYPIAWMAGSMLGLVLSPMNPSYKEREVAYQLENSEAAAIIVQRELLPLVLAARASAPTLRHILVTGADDIADAPDAIPFGRLIRAYSPARAPLEDIRGADLLALPYSSGTTGLPKGVMLTHQNLVINFHQFISSARVTESDVFLVFLPLYHIYGVALMGQAIFSGSALVSDGAIRPRRGLRAHPRPRRHHPARRAAGAAGLRRHAEPEPSTLPACAPHALRRRAARRRPRPARRRRHRHPRAASLRHDRSLAAYPPQPHRASADRPRLRWHTCERHRAEGRRPGRPRPRAARRRSGRDPACAGRR